MVVIVDDDDVTSEVFQLSLEETGLTVRGFASPTEALTFLQTTEPDLIVSDLMMPEMDGFAFRSAYLHAFPERRTPFLFISSVADPDVIVTGLDNGADDYIVKPIDHRVFVAKVRRLLARQRQPHAVYRGSLDRFSLPSIMKFCEFKAVTGSVTIASDELAMTLACRDGYFLLDDPGNSAQIETALGLTTGQFEIRIEPVDCSHLQQLAESATGMVASLAQQPLPMGKLSGVKIKGRLFQVQSEYVVHPDEQVITTVILDGRVLHKKEALAPLSLGRGVLQKLIESQHAATEDEIKVKINRRLGAQAAEEKTPQPGFNELFEKGWTSYCAGDYARAISLWEEALQLNPHDKVVKTNLNIARRKLFGSP